MLLPAQAGARHAGDAPWHRGRSQSRLTEDGLLRPAEHGFYRASQSDGPPWNSRAGSSHLGHGAAVSTPARPPGVVASVLSFRASPCSSASGTGPATSTRRQPSGSTLPTANSGDGSRENTSTMDSARGALSPLADRFPLRAREIKCSCGVMSRGRWRSCQQKNSNGASLWEEKACLDCLITKNQPDVGLQRAGRFIHHIQSEYRLLPHRTAVTESDPCRRHSLSDRFLGGATTPGSDALWASTQVFDL